MAKRGIEPALTYTLEDFVAAGVTDEMTYRNFSILEVIDGIEMVDHCLIEDYLDECISLCAIVELDNETYNKYKYCPDLLAYDVYGSTQLDFVVMYLNGIIDPKEFTMKKIKLPYASQLRTILSEIYNSNIGYIEQNRADNNISMY